MPFTSTNAVAALWVALGMSLPAAWADAPPKGPAASADSAAKADDANPLAAEDPFVGEFASDEMLVTLRLSVDGYVGEIRRGGRVYPLAAAADNKVITGAFTHGDSTFRFVAGLEGNALKLTTGNKVYLLARKGPAADATKAKPDQPATPTPQPPPDAPPRPPKPAPAPALPEPSTPALPAPPAPPAPPTPPTPLAGEPPRIVLSGPLPQHAGYAELSTQKLRDLAWARFPAGAYVVFEESIASAQSVPLSARRKMVYGGVTADRLQLQNFDWDGSKFSNSPLTVVQDEQAIHRIGELGLTPGQTTAENLTVQGAAIRCQFQQYKGEYTINDAATRLTAQVWRSREVDVPPLVVDLPGRKLILEPDIVRIKLTCELRGITGVIDMKLDTIRREVTVGKQTAQVAIIKSTSVFDRTDGKLESSAEYWLSAQVPGGILKSAVYEQMGDKRQARECTAIEFANFPRN